MPSRQTRSSGCCCACACAALSSSGPTRGLLLPELKYQWAMGASFAMGRQSLRRRGQPTKCRRSGLRPPTRGGSAREHLAEEIAVVPARPFGRVADHLADARVNARHPPGVALPARPADAVLAGTGVAI